MKGCVRLLESKGFKKMPWNKCPQGFEKAGYPCFGHDEKNLWVELYLTDPMPYGNINGPKFPYTGKFFYSTTELKNILKS